VRCTTRARKKTGSRFSNGHARHSLGNVAKFQARPLLLSLAGRASARRMEPVQIALRSQARLVEVNDRAGKNRLTNVLLGRFQILKTSRIPVAKRPLADRA